MTHVGYRSKNHPQQVAARADSEPSLFPATVDLTDLLDDRATPPAMFERLQQRFAFTVDVCASELNAKLPRYFDRELDGLKQPWAGERVWCNPPFSRIRPWLVKAWAEVDAPLVVMLLPANRTEQRWWQDLVEPRRDRGLGFSVEFLPGRTRFLRPAGVEIRSGNRPMFGCCLLVWERAARGT